MRSSRIYVLAALVVLAACGGEPSDTANQESSAVGTEGVVQARGALPEGTVRLRVVAANLTSGNNQSYDLGHGQRILQGLQPDVVLLQEFNYQGDSDEEFKTFATSFGETFSYSREPEAKIPNGVLSRFPIVASGQWEDPETFTRSFAWARIDVPGPRDLWAISVHLLTSNGGEREREAQALVEKIRDEVPESDFVTIGGDFNTNSRGEACLRIFAEVTRTSGPFPADASGNGSTSRARSKPLDWVLASRNLDTFGVPVEIGAQGFPNGLVFDSRKYAPLTDVAPVQRDDSNARNMQHMAVVRDFAIPGN